MRVVVVGGTGLIGSKLVRTLNEHGHQAVAAAPSTGVNTLTGAGLPEVLRGASALIDVSDPPSPDGPAAHEFFARSTLNLLAAEAAADVRHHVVLSMVNTCRLAPRSSYFDAKMRQESLIRDSGTAFTIVHATQFFERVKGIADAATDGDTVRLAPVLVQPIAAVDVAEALAISSVNSPLNAAIEVCGPRTYRLDELVRTALTARGDRRRVLADPTARFRGVELDETMLVPGAAAVRFDTHFEGWLLQSVRQKQ